MKNPPAAPMAERSIIIADCLEGDLADYCYSSIARYAPPGFPCIRLEAMREPIPERAEDWLRERNAAALIVSGAVHSPLDPDQWIRDLEEFARRCVAAELPALFICFGHELLASALGGGLVKCGRYIVELQEVSIDAEDPLFDGLGRPTCQPVAHSVMVESAPPGFRVVASTPDCPIQAMRHTELPVYGVQFHPEVDSGIKKPDPDWEAITDAEFAHSEGPALMRNFIRIALGGGNNK